LTRSQGTARLDIAVDRGRLECSTVEIDRAGAGRNAEVTLGSKALRARVERSGEMARVALTEPVTLASGETLSLVMR
jgi:hypothetical protein